MAELDTKEREKLAAQGKALPDGSFPIRNREDMQDAIRSYGRAKDKGEASRLIERREGTERRREAAGGLVS